MTTDLSLTVAGRTLLHTTDRWRTARNKHPNTNGTDWGWIEGAAGGDNTWSDDKRFNRKAAEEMCQAHNQWLEDQKPVAIRLIEANDRLRKAASRLRNAQAELDAAEREHGAAVSLVESLEAQRVGR